jgi:Holliday junction resolvase RusA-like endonuclease
MKYTILGTIPSKSNGYKFGKKVMYKSTPLKLYEESFALQLLQYPKTKRIVGDFSIEVVVYYESKRADLDGCFKILFDSLQKNEIIKNDRYCQKIIAERRIDKFNPRVEFLLTEDC